MSTPPVIFIVFNRPEVTARVLARIRDARPEILYVVCDGPRPNRPNDFAKVAAVRTLIDQGVDWPCVVHRDYAETNLGCRRRVASGLTQAFELLDEAIILEDDCLPDSSFFPYCAALLERYRHRTDVMHIAGTNLSPGRSATQGNYRFSHHPWIWGWATWRRAWHSFDFHMATWEERLPTLRASFASAWEAQYWISTYNQARSDLLKADTWGFPWMYTCRSLGALSLLPSVNLVENLGIGSDATHTRINATHLRVPASSIDLPLRHPLSPRIDRFADEAITRAYCHRLGWREHLKSRLRTLRAYQPSTSL